MAPTSSKPGRGTLRYKFRKAGQRLTRGLGVRYGARLIRHYARRCERVEVHRDRRDAFQEQGSGLIAAWHGRGAVAAGFWAENDVAVLVSASEDGKVATTILGRLGYEIVRGSSSRGGVRALREMLDALERGKHVAITPDGPRGPMHSVSPGLAFLSRASGVPILPTGYACDRTWELRTWDHYTIPRPGARLAASYGEPLVVPRESSSEDLEAACLELRRRLREAEREAAAALDMEPDWVDWTDEEPVAHGGDPALAAPPPTDTAADTAPEKAPEAPDPEAPDTRAPDTRAPGSPAG